MFFLKCPTEFVTRTKVVRQGRNETVVLIQGKTKKSVIKNTALSPGLFKSLSVGPAHDQVLTSDFTLGSFAYPIQLTRRWFLFVKGIFILTKEKLTESQ